ncbi:hypothetical protein Holit_00184 [Hollandina sp. SP2]
MWHTFKEVNEVFGVDSKGYYSLKKSVLLNTDYQKNAREQ